MGRVVVRLDVLEVGRRLESIVLPVETSQPGVDIRIAGSDCAQIALEVTDIGMASVETTRDYAQTGSKRMMVG